ncbi:hypothetical protein BACPEC_00919 [[Bacteroides] pectinophilus ATCC 43243]|uniref:Uncharacterized protein n=1 Tax=[Bacteroides] pectinophilus ATCC 43243 TaxID=483218 RepID=B7AQG2_9FIRM|nr:hypothetical protein BACPEC_00919 [[Bacteroides] pectinophilus ATCC 43243]
MIKGQKWRLIWIIRKMNQWKKELKKGRACGYASFNTQGCGGTQRITYNKPYRQAA